jgi:hypothetical protein
MNLLKSLTVIILLSARLLAADSAFPADGTYKADVLKRGMPVEAQDIGHRLQANMKANQEWFQAYLKEHRKPGESLPYHEKFGISEAEYKIFLTAAKQMTLQKSGEAIAHIERKGDAVIVRIEGYTLPADTFEFSAKEGIMTCSMGMTVSSATIEQKDENTPTGAWSGKQWTLVQGDMKEATVKNAYEVRFSIGQDSQSRHLIFIHMIGRKDLTPLDVNCILRWPQE